MRLILKAKLSKRFSDENGAFDENHIWWDIDDHTGLASTFPDCGNQEITAEIYDTEVDEEDNIEIVITDKTFIELYLKG
jgi:hypothetical protein